MKLSRFLLAAALLACLAGVAYVSQRTETTAQKMTSAAQQFLQALTAEQKEKAALTFDSKERFNWNFVPLEKGGKPTRKGLMLKDMTDAQKKAAMALVAAGTSDSGNLQAATIMSLESILRELEKKGKITRDPEWYFFTVFGTPSKNGPWGWRVEGHHLSLNFTLDKGQVASATPFFFGANPAEVKSGPRKGFRTLPQAENLARELFKSLDKEQQKVAYRADPFPEPQQGKTEPNVGKPVGLAAAKMTPDQRDLLRRLIEAYARRMPPEVAKVELKQLQEAGVEKIHFAFTGSRKAGGPGYTYRVQGPTFVIEFLNDQNDSAGNPANHIHSAWRRIKGDFGLGTN
jgi:hypothetical protein